MSIHHNLAKTEAGAAVLPAPAVERTLRLVEPLRAPAAPAFRHPAQRTAKRTIDVIFALLLLVLFAPVMFAVALAIKLDTHGAVLFRQQRLGLNGRPFYILKFRSMTVAEDGDAVVQARRNDPRVTRVGAFLRMWSLDEVPQLINVLRGEMSLVGPRPHARAHDELYAALIGHYTERQRVKPGITGWAQVHGCRGETPTLASMRARVDYDVWYAAHADIALDFEILLRTAIEVFHHRNAY
ncbi:MAG: exopolysaccharide biosynthesis polyprenyl glycosylphosphotransferase [Alphaproteobacteria bacterium]|nr:exopolysaccharide biosynthesis polyprenyl glycosylphosphotransferase [Alphaproteobacteria bacterium]MBU6471752.1 exopolysaccharide biosynthesis polyprenyl glycosylphosphotransferase [Alphaproteobacteria bacterium]MDE2013351.1 exopolysaccharide biosynthesis polyprenyl glycosylphosphotransferase [Alphaproteobacteria bacterium]MDE2073890.1 exopolysaccharide biosynthesis polyprenyl glycosylphosphotransferase [Alphaproteobacteria bacterium]